jgi:DNA primase
MQDVSRPVSVKKQIKAIKDAVPLMEVASRHTTLVPTGVGRAKGICPLPDHQEKTPSFVVYPDGRWWCFGCDRGGDVVDLYVAIGGFSILREALGYMGLEYEVDLPGRPESWFPKQSRQAAIREGIEAARIEVARRRLYRAYFLPSMNASIGLDEEDRRHDEELLWELALPLAEELVRVMKSA